ncbi:hypothetical protein R1flu_006586 [Riccia fluitans]|uniref:Uncharacterized protein n=1 Tax=Riccia fluitans TaxID=41844 RepID=A0ABD1Z0I0_9MARC
MTRARLIHLEPDQVAASNESASPSEQPVRKKSQAVEVTLPQGGEQQEPAEEEATEEESPLIIRHQENRSKESQMRSVPLRIGSSMRDDPVPATTAGREMVDQAFGQAMQMVITTPDSTIAPQPMVAADK